jgi:hypothetical protein
MIRLVWYDALTQNFVEAHRAEALLYDCSEQSVQHFYVFEKLYITPSLEYSFLDKVVEIGRVDYWPTDEDILRCRRISTGISMWHGWMGSTPYASVFTRVGSATPTVDAESLPAKIIQFEVSMCMMSVVRSRSAGNGLNVLTMPR